MIDFGTARGQQEEGSLPEEGRNIMQVYQKLEAAEEDGTWSRDVNLLKHVGGEKKAALVLKKQVTEAKAHPLLTHPLLLQGFYGQGPQTPAVPFDIVDQFKRAHKVCEKSLVNQQRFGPQPILDLRFFKENKAKEKQPREKYHSVQPDALRTYSVETNHLAAHLGQTGSRAAHIFEKWQDNWGTLNFKISATIQNSKY
jgi:hypothetical protein